MRECARRCKDRFRTVTACPVPLLCRQCSGSRAVRDCCASSALAGKSCVSLRLATLHACQPRTCPFALLVIGRRQQDQVLQVDSPDAPERRRERPKPGQRSGEGIAPAEPLRRSGRIPSAAPRPQLYCGTAAPGCDSPCTPAAPDCDSPCGPVAPGCDSACSPAAPGCDSPCGTAAPDCDSPCGTVAPDCDSACGTAAPGCGLRGRRGSHPVASFRRVTPSRKTPPTWSSSSHRRLCGLRCNRRRRS